MEETFATYYEPQPGVLVSKIKPISVSDDEFDAYLVDLVERVKAYEGKLVLINDVSESYVLPSSQRMKIAATYKQEDALFKSKVLRLVYVMPSPVLQFVLNAVMVIQRPPVKHKVFSGIDQAITWSKELLLKNAA